MHPPKPPALVVLVNGENVALGLPSSPCGAGGSLFAKDAPVAWRPFMDCPLAGHVEHCGSQLDLGTLDSPLVWGTASVSSKGATCIFSFPGWRRRGLWQGT